MVGSIISLGMIFFLTMMVMVVDHFTLDFFLLSMIWDMCRWCFVLRRWLNFRHDVGWNDSQSVTN